MAKKGLPIFDLPLFELRCFLIEKVYFSIAQLMAASLSLFVGCFLSIDVHLFFS